MNRYSPKSVPLGDLIAAVFDEAAQHSSDTREVSLLVTLSVMDLYRRSSRANGHEIDRERSPHDATAR